MAKSTNAGFDCTDIYREHGFLVRLSKRQGRDGAGVRSVWPCAGSQREGVGSGNDPALRDSARDVGRRIGRGSCGV